MHVSNRPETLGPNALDEIEREVEELVLGGKTLICGVHNDAHRRATVGPLRRGPPRIVVVSGGFRYHLGESLKDEPFRTPRLWRCRWDALSDLIVSRRAPDRLPTFSLHNPTVNRLIAGIVERAAAGLSHPTDPFGPMFLRG